MRILLPVSAALNLLLITGIVMARVDMSRAQTERSSSSDESEASLSVSRVPDPSSAQELHDLLVASGLSEQSIKPLMLGWVVARYAARDTIDDAFWKENYNPAKQEALRRLDIDAQARQDLLQIYGSAAIAEPIFASLFRPLGASLDFLSSSKQLQLQRTGIESGRVDARIFNSACTLDQTGSRAAPSPQSDLLASLDSTARLEYLLRFSPLAQRLRESRVVDDEKQFRTVFDVARALETAVSPKQLADIRRQLRSILGNEGFDRFWATQDPLHAELVRYLQSEGLNPNEIAAAYAVINESQDALLSALGQGASQDRISAIAAKAREREIAGLGRVLGRQGAERLLARHAELAMGLSAPDHGC